MIIRTYTENQMVDIWVAKDDKGCQPAFRRKQVIKSPLSLVNPRTEQSQTASAAITTTTWRLAAD